MHTSRAGNWQHVAGVMAAAETAVVVLVLTEWRFAAPGGDIKGLALPKRVFPCATPAEVHEHRVALILTTTPHRTQSPFQRRLF